MVPLYVLALSAASWAGQSNGMVLDFSAGYCEPCRNMSPIVSRLERQGYPIHTVDIERERELAQRYRITNIPAFVLIVNGKEVTRIVGETSEANLRQLLARIPTAKPENVAAGSRTAGATDTQSDNRKTASPPPAIASSAAPAKSKSRIPFLFGKEAPAAQPAEAAVVRAKLGDSGAVAPSDTRSAPLAASTRIRVTDSKGENFGSGTIIDSRIGRTLVLTCGHIFRNLEPKSSIEVDLFTTGRAETFVGKVVRYDLEADVGLIAIPTDVPVPSCRVAPPSFQIVKAMPVVSVGCGGGELPSEQQLRVTALNRYLGPDNLECSGVPVQGRSGGGLFTRDGLVVGVCTAADPRDQRGLYAGVKAIQGLLDECKLAHLYRTTGAAERQVAVALPAAQTVEVEETAEAAGVESTTIDGALEGAAKPQAADLAVLDQGSLEGAAGEAEALRAALSGADHAEVVCVIRPIGQPRAASRVVVINRASPRFVSYLTDEFVAQADVQATALTSSPRTAVRGHYSAAPGRHGPAVEEKRPVEKVTAEKRPQTAATMSQSQSSRRARSRTDYDRVSAAAVP